MNEHVKFIEKQKGYLDNLRIKIKRTGNMNAFEKSKAFFKIDTQLDRVNAYLDRLKTDNKTEVK